ncbi:hypothetical protein [Breoghania sp.]|uniref:hypothetical protein n=1 Tax=Breoghania sp. TaxID=2065378 RepID=UPI002AA8D34E|nr:hypothetical protein [Breoghania sp.]
MFGFIEKSQLKMHESNLGHAYDFAQVGINNGLRMGDFFCELNDELEETFCINMLSDLENLLEIPVSSSDLIADYFMKKADKFARSGDTLYMYYCCDIFCALFRTKSIMARRPALVQRTANYTYRALSLISNCLEICTKKQEALSATTALEYEAEEEADKENALVMVRKLVMRLGNDLTDYGVAVALLSLESGYSVAETASHISVVTFARNLKRTADEGDIVALITLAEVGVATAEVLKELKDDDLIRDEIWANDVRAISKMMNPSPEAMEWADKVLSDPVIAKEPVAVSRILFKDR